MRGGSTTIKSGTIKPGRLPERSLRRKSRVDAFTADALVPKLQAISQNGYDQRIFVRGDKTVAYDRVMVVMGLLASAGFTHIGLVTDVAKPKPDKH